MKTITVNAAPPHWSDHKKLGALRSIAKNCRNLQCIDGDSRMGYHQEVIENPNNKNRSQNLITDIHMLQKKQFILQKKLICNIGEEGGVCACVTVCVVFEKK